MKYPIRPTTERGPATYAKFAVCTKDKVESKEFRSGGLPVSKGGGIRNREQEKRGAGCMVGRAKASKQSKQSSHQQTKPNPGAPCLNLPTYQTRPNPEFKKKGRKERRGPTSKEQNSPVP